jgi:hypothetical protein
MVLLQMRGGVMACRTVRSGFWYDAEWRVTGYWARELMTVELGAVSAYDAIECFPAIVDEVDA